MGQREEIMWRPWGGTERGWCWQGRETLKDEAGPGVFRRSRVQPLTGSRQRWRVQAAMVYMGNGWNQETNDQALWSSRQEVMVAQVRSGHTYFGG